MSVPLSDKQIQKMNEDLVVYQQCSRYQIMSQVCPSISLDQAFMAGWIAAANDKKKKHIVRGARNKP